MKPCSNIFAKSLKIVQTDSRAYENAEDPLHVLDNNLPVDTKHYLENQLSKPLMRIFEPIMGDKANSLLAGDHTRSVTIATPTTGGLMGFVKKTLTCLGCRSPLTPSTRSGSKYRIMKVHSFSAR